ncbi:MAG: protein jag [Defluviitaleaceae bacterium]|nr:protein jag [Defluviitaleaceae bacterium]
MESIEKSGKTVEQAIEAALRALSATKEEVDIKTIDPGAKGFLGIGAKPARVLVSRKFDPERIAKTFIKEMGMAMNLIINIETRIEDRSLIITLSGENMGILIGKRGQTLDAIQLLVSLTVNKGTAPYISIVVDSENYRARRKETLEQLALSIARKVRETKRSVTLEPMNTFERRIIHAALQNDKLVSTYSEGTDPYRNIVIAPRKPQREHHNRDYHHHKDREHHKDRR